MDPITISIDSLKLGMNFVCVMQILILLAIAAIQVSKCWKTKVKDPEQGYPPKQETRSFAWAWPKC